MVFNPCYWFPYFSTAVLCMRLSSINRRWFYLVDLILITTDCLSINWPLCPVLHLGCHQEDQSGKRRGQTTRAVRRRTGGRRRRWVVLWPAAAASAASDRMREQWNSALAGQGFFSGLTEVSHFTCDLRWAAGAEDNNCAQSMHIHSYCEYACFAHNFTVVMS